MSVESAGLLPYRWRNGRLEVFLVHPGGPFYAHRDAGVWSIAKGIVETGEDALAAARREFEEETGQAVDGEFLPLGELRQRSGKRVHAWAVAADIDPATVRSNTFEMEWPRGSGQIRRFPEVDRGAWFDIETAREKILPGQAAFLDRLAERLGSVEDGAGGGT